MTTAPTLAQAWRLRALAPTGARLLVLPDFPRSAVSAAARRSVLDARVSAVIAATQAAAIG